MRACGSCHRTEGTGGPENASLAGLPASYIVQQMADYKSGARKFSGPQRSPVLLMSAMAKTATDEEVQAAAAYFSFLKPKPNIKVVETDTVPGDADRPRILHDREKRRRGAHRRADYRGSRGCRAIRTS